MNYSKKGFKKSDFGGMAVDIFCSNLYSIPIIKKYKEFNPPTMSFDKQQILKYVILAFDKKSPLKMTYTDPIEVRVVAAEIMEFPKLKSGGFEKKFDQIIRSQNFTVNLMVITYLFLQNEHDVLTLIAYEEALRIQSSRLVGEESSATDVKNIISNIDLIKSAIDKIKKSIVEEPTDELLKRDLFTFTQSKRLNIKPEDYAAKFNIKDPQKGVLKNTPH